MKFKYLLIVIAIILVIIIITVSIKNTNKSSTVIDSDGSSTVVNISETSSGGYSVQKSNGENVVTNSIVEAEWYQDHPDYNPEPVHFGEETIE